MKTPLTDRMLMIIDLMQTQRKALAMHHVEVLKDNYDYFVDLKSLYADLNKPKGMDNSIACFEAVMQYPITDEMRNTESEELPKRYEFGY